MKVDRRSFLSFIIGGAAGTALTPLPWKLTDDSAIWSQMWPWIPVPEKGESTYTASTCTLCPGGCGIHVRKVDERVVKIEGLAGHPVNDGGLCLLGLSGAQLLYGPRRIKTPLKKVDGRFRAISWDAALEEIGENLSRLRAGGNPQKFASICDSDRGTVPELLQRFMTVYGSPNFIRIPSILDSYELTLFLTQGVRALPGFDLKNSDVVLSFGSGLLDGWGSPVYAFQAHSEWQERGAKLIQVEPRLSRTAAKSDQWIAVTPGSEAALALGIAHVIIKESLYDRKFVENHTTGFEAWKRQVMDGFDPARVAKITGVDSQVLTRVAREFAGAGRPLALCGRGKGNTPGSLKEFMAVHSLNALVGSIGAEGGVWALPEPDYIDWPEPEMDGTASAGMQQERIDGAGSSGFPLSRYLLNRLPEALGTGAEPSIEVLFISEVNPCYSMPANQAFIDACKKIPLVVSFSSYMDETAQVADLILPNHIYLERFQDLPVAAGFNRPTVGLVRPVVEPLFDTMHTGDVIIQLAKSLEGSIADAFPWENYDGCLEETMGDKFEAMVEQGYWIDNGFAPPKLDEAFETPSSKFEFVNPEIPSVALVTPVKPKGEEASFPLTLIPFDTMRLWGGYIADPQFVIKSVDATVLIDDDVLVEVNPKTAGELGLKDGQKAVLATPLGQAAVKVHLFEGIAPELVALPSGLGHYGQEKNIADKGVNTNTLIGPVEDPLTGFDAAWGIRAKLTRV